MIDSLDSQVDLLVDLSLKLVEQLPTQGKAPLEDLISCHKDHFRSLLVNLKDQMRIREETYERAMSKTRSEQDLLQQEISRVEAILGKDTSVLHVTSARGSPSTVSTSQVDELVDLRNRLQSQMSELDSLFRN